MADDKDLRREFITKTSMPSSTGDTEVQEAEQYVQSDYSVRTKALISVLTKKNLVNPATIDAVVDYFENKVGPHIGAKVVARSWLDSAYRERLLADARAVAREDNLTGIQGTDLVVVENTPEVHNLVVCTLCSCYPWSLLGLPPSWYKDTAYRSQAVIDSQTRTSTKFSPPRGSKRQFSRNPFSA